MKKILKGIPAEPKVEVTHPLLDKVVSWLIVGLFSSIAIMIILYLL